MDGSRVTQTLDFLWYFTNVLTASTHDEDHPVPSLTTHHSSPSSIHNANEPPNPPFILVNQKHHEEPQLADEHFMSLTPRCLNCGEISSPAFEDDDKVMMHVKSGKETKKRDHRRKRRKKKLDKSSRLNGTEVIIEGLDNANKRFSGFLKSYEYDDDEMIKTSTKLPPFDDDVAMKQHLKSWAYAVACTVKWSNLIWKV